MNGERRSGDAAVLLGLLLALAAACGDPPNGPDDFLGQVRVRPAFLAGDAPDQVGVRIDSMGIRLRNEASGALSVDTVVAYEEGTSLSWILELESEGDPVTVELSLRRLADILYLGDRELVVREGTIGAAPLEEVTVRFQGAEAERVEVTPKQATLDRPGLTQEFVATVYDANGDPIADRMFTWTSSAPRVARVDADGLATSVGNGTSLIIAGVAGVADTAALTAYDIDSIVVQPADTTLLAIGSTARLTATAFDSDGEAVSGVTFDWSTADSEVASVDSSGRVTARGRGTARIVAAAAFDANGNPIPGLTFAWSTSDSGVATVDPAGVNGSAGLVTAIARGIADIAASARGKADTAVVSVALKDSVTYTIDAAVVITTAPGETEAILGDFIVPTHVPQLGVAVQVDVELTFDEQRDEAFAVGTLESGQIAFLGDPDCPIVEDDGTLGRGWVPVAVGPMSPGVKTLIARHALEFPCYVANAADGVNSVHFHGVRFVYYTTQ